MLSLSHFLLEKIEHLEIVLSVPHAIKARRQGCRFEIYKMVYGLRQLGIMPYTILDVGANNGVFTKTANFVFPQSSIHAFEPLPACYDTLCSLKPQIPNLTCYNMALGSESKETTIHHNEFHYSSSLLEMRDVHKTMFPYTSNETLEMIRVEKLDSAFDVTLARKPVLLKIDVQGYEKKVLEGGQKTLQHVDFIVCEVSFVELYKDQPLFREIYEYLNEFGFKFEGILGELKDPRSNQTIQIDALFKR
jgi:FkbM family methyltransferase